MNIDDVDLETHKIPNTVFIFSAAKPDSLLASEYTLVTIAVDISGSVLSFQNDLLKMLNAIIDACRKSPRAENLLIRVIRFSSQVEEIHGFLPLVSLPAYELKDIPCSGTTSLFDAMLSSISAMNVYGKTLTSQDYNVNGIFFVITDGQENSSITHDPAVIKKEIDRAIADETMGGITSVLVGVNMTQRDEQSLRAIQAAAGISTYVSVADASPGRLAHLAGFVSKSISSTSQSLAQGGSAPVSVSQLSI